ncbi:hypothetical protein AMK22_07745 [Streptomyces sp. CB01580]|nr:hypothetical protein AMK22_07745 [Streptomyces sp. CB01580]
MPGTATSPTWRSPRRRTAPSGRTRTRPASSSRRCARTSTAPSRRNRARASTAPGRRSRATTRAAAR